MTNIVSTSYSGSLKTFYEKRLLMRAVPRFVHTRCGERAVLNRGYNALEWRRYGGLTASTTALTEGTTPAEAAAPTLTQITATPSYYGAWLRYSDKMDLQNYDPTVAWVSGVLGEQAGLSVDTIARNYLTTAANTTKLYSNGKASRVTLDAPGDNLTYADVLKALATLQAANTLPLTWGGFDVLIHPHSMASLFQDPTFVNVFVHANPADANNPMKTGYIGRFLNLDFYVSSNVREYVDGGVGGTTDVYDMSFFGLEAFGIAGVATLDPREVDTQGPMGNPLTGKGVAASPVELILHNPGESGSEDPLNQRGSVGWKVAFDVQSLNTAFQVSLEHTNVFSDDV